MQQLLNTVNLFRIHHRLLFVFDYSENTATSRQLKECN